MDQVAQVATTRTQLVVEQMCCTSASQHYCVLLNDVQLFLPSSLNFGVASMGTKCDLHEEHLSASDDDEEDLTSGPESSQIWQMKSWVELDQAAIMRWIVCVRSCTPSEGCLTMIGIVLDCSDEFKLQRQHSVLMRERRALIFETPKNVDFLSPAFAHPCHWLPTPRTRDVRA